MRMHAQQEFYTNIFTMIPKYNNDFKVDHVFKI